MNMSQLLLPSAESWPRPTFTPAATSSGSGVTPAPPHALALGWCDTFVRVSRSSASSTSESQMQWAATQSGPSTPQS